MDNTDLQIDQQQQNKVQDIPQENIHVSSQSSLKSNKKQEQSAKPEDGEAMISSQASTIKQDPVEQSQIQNTEVIHENNQITQIKQEEQSEQKDTQQHDIQQEGELEMNKHDIQQGIQDIDKQPVTSKDKCAIHDIKNKYVCIQQNCNAASRIACAECHVEGPHPKHELVKIESFTETVSQKSKKAIEVFESINKDSAKTAISNLIQKIQDDFIQQLNEFKEEKLQQIDAANLIGDDLLTNDIYENDFQINYKEILPLFVNQQINFTDTSLLKLALILYSSEQNDSVEVSKANFHLFIEDIQKDINHLEKNFQKAFIQRIDSSQNIEEENAKATNIDENPKYDQANNQLQNGTSQQNQGQNSNQIQSSNSNQAQNQNKNYSIIHKKNISSAASKETYNWRERKEQQKQEEDKYLNQEGNSTVLRKTLQLKLKGQCIKKLQDHKGWIGRIERVNENVFASCSSDKKVIFWDINRMKAIKTYTSEPTAKYHTLSLCKLDSKTIAMGCSDKLIRIYEWETETMIKLLKGHKGGVNYIISLSEEVISSCGSDNGIVVWNWNHHTQTIYQICILHSNSFLASCSKDTTIKIYNFDKKEVSSVLKGAKQAIHTICYLKKNLLASGSADQTIRIYNYIQSLQIKVIKVPNQSIYTLCRIDDHYIASGQSDNKIKVWAYEEGETLENSVDSRHGYGALCVKTLESHTSAVSCLSYLPEKFILISGSNDHSICIWQ